MAALMLRGDKLGVTSFIRDLDLSHKCYENLLHFFHSGSYLLQSLRAQWYRIVLEKAPIHRVEGRSILIGDGVKQSKEALRMPGVKKMVQESETSSKPEYIHGHLFGVVGIIISGWNNRFCLPLKSNIQDGLKAISSWPESKGIVDISGRSHVEQIIEAGFEAAKVIGKSFLVLDRYFLSRPALELLDRQNRSLETSAGPSVVVVTKAKANCTAYRHPRRKAGSKGRPPRKGKPVKLTSLFTQNRFFKEAPVRLYGKDEIVSILENLLDNLNNAQLEGLDGLPVFHSVAQIMGRSGLEMLYLRYCYELGYLPKYQQKGMRCVRYPEGMFPLLR